MVLQVEIALLAQSLLQAVVMAVATQIHQPQVVLVAVVQPTAAVVLLVILQALRLLKDLLAVARYQVTLMLVVVVALAQ